MATDDKITNMADGTLDPSSCIPTENSLIVVSDDTLEGRIAIARHHFEQKGYRVHSGLQFGCELVLYADTPGRVHSDFCVVVVGPEERWDWRRIQTLVRSMPSLHKTLIVAGVRRVSNSEASDSSQVTDKTEGINANYSVYSAYRVDELAIASEHAPFRHKNQPKGVGLQTKPTNNI